MELLRVLFSRCYPGRKHMEQARILHRPGDLKAWRGKSLRMEGHWR